MLEVAEAVGGMPAAADHVSEHLCSKVRVFLAEVAEGVSNYRSMHNLTEQVEHQYHGRFLIELIQNSHDALGGGGGRIEVRFEQGDGDHGSLLVANDGEPFSRSNFEKISALGQSDKDPQKNIGNKGIGFRSVLELTDSPEIYSRRTPGSTDFDGYCFAFRPSTVSSLVEPMTQLATEQGVPLWAMSGRPLVRHWSDEMLAQYRARVASMGRDWLAQEVRYLSPYLLPVPLRETANASIQELEQAGFATVVRLPLKSSAAASKVKEQLAALSPATCLFLWNLRELKIRESASRQRTYCRTVTPDATGPTRVVLSDDSSNKREYLLWRTSVRIENAPAAVKAAVAALPGRWPEMHDAEVSIAIRSGVERDAGIFSIYLPTNEVTGSAVHVNAPFYGDINRTSIAFDNAYNRHLVDVAVDLALQAALAHTKDVSLDAGRAVLDLLSPLAKDGPGDKWAEHMCEAVRRARVDIGALSLIPADSGWSPLRSTFQVPALGACRFLKEGLVRQLAGVAFLHRELSHDRAKQFELLKEQFFGERSARITTTALATLVAAAAETIRRDGGDWNAFWKDVVALLPGAQRDLARCPVLLGVDGELHKVDGGAKVFFLPRQGTPDALDVESDGSTSEVPTTLRRSVAFLSEKIELYDVGRGISQNIVRDYLGQGLVTPFRVETIFTDILRRLTPALPVPHGSDEATRCRDIFSWGMRLMRNVVARGRGAPETLKLLRDLPAPCLGGWYKLKDTMFGRGWGDGSGEVLERYLGSLSSSIGQHAYGRLLLPAGETVFAEIGAAAGKDLLLKGGASEFLALHEVTSAEWSSSLQGSYALNLPSTSPAGFGAKLWQEVVAASRHVNLPYVGLHQYRVDTLWSFPGLEEYETLSLSQREQLSSLVLQALPNWATLKWKSGVVTKIGGYSGRAAFDSPLSLFLRNQSWLAVQEDALTWNRPQDRWLVPADTLASRAKHYAHLRALPAAVAAQIAARPGLVDELRSLGMRVFNGRDETASTALLEALTSAVGSDAVADSNVLLGQLRDAWEQFRPDGNSVPLEFVAVRSRDRALRRLKPSVDEPVVLPDQGTLSGVLEDLGMPVLAMQPRAAQRLREWFQSKYVGSVQLASEMSVRPRVAGALWAGNGATPLSDSSLAWLFTPLLVLVSQGRSVHAAAFKERHETLSSAKVAWVDGLELSVVRPDAQPLAKRVPSLWDAQSGTLLVDVSCRTQLAEMSPALAHALERDDLQISIRLILSVLGKLPEGEPDIFELLRPLGTIGDEEIHHVLEHLRGDVGYVVRYARVLARARRPGEDVSDIEAAASEEELTAALQRRGLTVAQCTELFQVARNTNDMFDFGATLAGRWSDFPPLARWNDSLRSFSLSSVSNNAWRSQFDAFLEELTWLGKRVARHALACSGIADATYAGLCSAFARLGEHQSLAEAAWRVDISDVAPALVQLFAGWLPGTDLQMLSICSTKDEFTWSLEQAGIDLKVDPDELGRANTALIHADSKRLERIRLAWLLKQSSEVPPGAEGCVERLARAIGDELARNAFVTGWDSQKAFEMLKIAFARSFSADDDFALALAKSSSLEDLRARLGLTQQDLDDSEERLRATREAAARRQNVIQVCGKEFDASESNLKNLWGHVTTEIPDSALSSALPLDLEQTALLEKPRANAPRAREKPSATPKRPRRLAKSVEETIGLAGEIFVFRMLRQRYGEEAVSASAWISENSRYVYESNAVNDGFGCDFAFSVKGRQYRVEVKATQGEGDVFSLGSSEIALAMELAGKTKRRKETFLIVHVKNALSASPNAVVLPNPYDPGSEGLFRIEEAEARVRYRSRGMAGTDAI